MNTEPQPTHTGALSPDSPAPTPAVAEGQADVAKWPIMPQALIQQLERVRALPPCATRIEQVRRDSMINEAVEALRRLQHVGRRVHNAYSSLLRVE